MPRSVNDSLGIWYAQITVKYASHIFAIYGLLRTIIVRQSKIERWGETEVLSISIYSVLCTADLNDAGRPVEQQTLPSRHTINLIPHSSPVRLQQKKNSTGRSFIYPRPVTFLVYGRTEEFHWYSALKFTRVERGTNATLNMRQTSKTT